jgi:hypothetical protein
MVDYEQRGAVTVHIRSADGLGDERNGPRSPWPAGPMYRPPAPERAWWTTPD